MGVFRCTRRMSTQKFIKISKTLDSFRRQFVYCGGYRFGSASLLCLIVYQP